METVYSIVDNKEKGTESFFYTYNPATKEKIAMVYKADEEIVKETLESSSLAFESWSNINIVKRAEYLKKMADIIDANREELARILTIQQGKTLKESRNEINNAHKVLYYYYGEARRTTSYLVKSENDEVFMGTVRMPLGIVYVITPFNSPFSIPFWNIAPALLHGNTVIFKPASITSLVSKKIQEIFLKSGLPSGVVNVLYGSSEMISNILLNDERVQAVAFTGSSEVGLKLSEINGRMKRRQILELGGKNAAIVMDDCDIERTVASLLFAAFSNAGQRCSAASRLLVHTNIYDKFINLFKKGMENIIVGNGLDPSVHMGPVASEYQYLTVWNYINDAIERGIKPTKGGFKYTDHRKEGYFIPPTMFEIDDPKDKIAQEEIFGPVVTVLPIKNLEEGIDIANKTQYGLISAVYTENISNAFKVIDRTDTGVTFVNLGPTGIEYSVPYQGYKKSGFGEELGLTSIMNYTKTKSIYIDYSKKKRESFWYLF